jgi:hypothetical protein
MGATDPAPVSATRAFRQLSLDLRGAPPSFDEARAVQRTKHIPDALLDAVLRDERFLGRVKRWHADLLWPTLGSYWIHAGGSLVLSPPRGQRGIVFGQGTPERALMILDRRSNEGTCPPVTSEAHLTAAVCCTMANPNHPACCLVRNAAYDPNDLACLAKARALPALFDFGVAHGDRDLRGGDTFYLGCDSSLEYPPPRVALDDVRFTHDATGRPYYISPRSGARRFYYDDRGVPLPYDDARHCPNFCRRARGSGPNGAHLRSDYVAKQRRDGSTLAEGDGEGFVCPEGFVEQRNACDNIAVPPATSRLWAHVEIRQEGARLVRHWWAGNHLVNTCAYQAQERATSLTSGAPCQPGHRVDATCGCGPNGVLCQPFTGSNTHRSPSERALLEALREEPLEIVASVVARGEDYFTSLTTRRGFVNGPLSILYRQQTQVMQEIEFSPPAPVNRIPEVPYDDRHWHEYERGPEHAGVLTTPAFLGRFPTWRARINRFRTAWLCQPFAPPATPPPAADDACNREPDLARRCGCRSCHSTIEPLGAHWGRWAERSARYLDPATFPAIDMACARCAHCDPRCRQYVTAGSAFVGHLLALQYRASDERAAIDAGPANLVREAIASGELQACTVRTTWARLMRRPMRNDEARNLLPVLVRNFDASGHDYRGLVRAIVTSPEYGRID